MWESTRGLERVNVRGREVVEDVEASLLFSGLKCSVGLLGLRGGSIFSHNTVGHCRKTACISA